MDLKIFSTKLKYLRKKANLTQVQLAEMLHISQAQISRYETGLDEPSEDCLQALSAAFEIDGQSAALFWSSPLPDIPKDSSDGTSENFARRLRAIRQYHGKSQKDFAQFLGISQSLISALEIGKATPDLVLIQKLGKMGFDLEWLVFGSHARDSPKEILDDLMPKRTMQQIQQILRKMPPQRLDFICQFLALILTDTKNKRDA